MHTRKEVKIDRSIETARRPRPMKQIGDWEENCRKSAVCAFVCANSSKWLLSNKVNRDYVWPSKEWHFPAFSIASIDTDRHTYKTCSPRAGSQTHAHGVGIHRTQRASQWDCHRPTLSRAETGRKDLTGNRKSRRHRHRHQLESDSNGNANTTNQAMPTF